MHCYHSIIATLLLSFHHLEVNDASKIEKLLDAPFLFDTP